MISRIEGNADLAAVLRRLSDKYDGIFVFLDPAVFAGFSEVMKHLAGAGAPSAFATSAE